MNKTLTKNISQTIDGILALVVFRKMFANYGHEEGMKQILVRQIQQILEREKQPNLISTVAQSFSQ